MLYLVLLIACASNIPISNSRVIDLSSDWTLVNSNLNYNINSISIPASVHSVLMDRGLIENPLYRYNDLSLRWIGNNSHWVFQKNIKGPYENRSTVLEMESIDTIASIYVNQKLLTLVNNQFYKHKVYNLERYLTNEDNLLEIRFVSPVEEAYKLASSYTYKFPPECPPSVQKGECHVNLLRKEQCSYSWDWGPSLAPIGIAGPVYLNVLDRFDFNFYVSIYSVDLNNWTLDIDIDFDLDHPDSESDSFEALIQIQSLNYQTTQQVVLDKTTGKYKIMTSLNRDTYKIGLWWPSGYGEQKLYDLSIQITEKKSQTSISKTKKIGFRKVEMIEDQITNCKTEGLLFKFRINQLDIFLKGSNWIPADSLQEKISNGYLRWLLESAKNSNMNVLRIWGGGVYESEDFYNLADELGIMIWQDFMFAVATYPTNKAFLDSVALEVEYQVNRLRHRPCVIVWAANNENEAAIADNWFNTNVNKTLYSDDYRRLYIDTVMNTILKHDVEISRPFLSSSPTNGKKSIESNYLADKPYDLRFGDLHYYNYQANFWDESQFPIPRLMSEFGVQSLPSYSTLNEVYDFPDDAEMLGPLNQHRQHHGNGNEEILEEIAMNLNLPKLEDKVSQFRGIIYLSQINQAMTLRTGSELYRRSRSILDTETCVGYCMGTMYWQFNDLWQAPTWATIEYTQNYKYGKWKMGHYYVKNAYSDVILSSTSNQTHYSIYAVSDLARSVDSDVEMLVFGYDSLTPRHRETIKITALPYSSSLVYTLELSKLKSLTKCSDTQSCIIKLIPSSPQIQENFFFLNYKLSAVQNLKKPNLKISEIAKLTDMSFRITLETDQVALFVWLDLETTKIGGVFSDNGFHMTTKTHTIILDMFDKGVLINDIKVNLKSQSLMDLYNTNISNRIIPSYMLLIQLFTIFIYLTFKY